MPQGQQFDQRNIVELMTPGHLVDVEPSVEAEDDGVEEEEHEWLQVAVADAVRGPGAVMIHPVNAPAALAAVVHALNLRDSALGA